MSDRAQLLGEGPRACPFVAFDDDRDRRSDEPDHRHRCYAEPTPAPRAIAHQSAYCLSPGFAACPIFLDWAVRAAADPVPSSSVAAVWAERAAVPSPEQLSAFPEQAHPTPGYEDEDLAAADHRRAGEALDAAAWSPGPTGRTDPRATAIEPIPAAPGRAPAPGPAAMGSPAARGASGAGAIVGRHAGDRSAREEPWPDVEGTGADAPPPPFLAGRHRSDERAAHGPRPRVATQARPLAVPKRSRGERDPVLPSWDRPRPMEAYPTLRTGFRMRRIPPVALAAIALFLAAAALFLLPGLLAGPGAGPGSTETPIPTAVASLEPTPTPAPTQTTYIVRSGDTLSRIARRFGLTVDQLRCANELADPNRLAVDQVLIIPDDEFECPGSPAPSPTG